MIGSKPAREERHGAMRAYCVRCERQTRLAEQPYLRRVHSQWQMTGTCATCGTPVHQFVRKEGEVVGPKKRIEHRHTVKISGGVKEALQIASLSMGWSQTEVVEYLMREHLLDLMNSVTRDGQRVLPPRPEGLLHLPLTAADGDHEWADDEGHEDEEGEEGAGNADDAGVLSRLWRRLAPG